MTEDNGEKITMAIFMVVITCLIILWNLWWVDWEWKCMFDSSPRACVTLLKGSENDK